MQQVEQLRHAATHDGLTQLPNRALFIDRAEQAVRHAVRHDERFALALFDVDEFRDINNRFGHLAGDVVLQAVARRTRRCVRDTDTVARLGGDEFGLILPGVTSRPAVAAILEKVRLVNAVGIPFGNEMLSITVSIGVAMFPEEGRSEVILRKRADAAMYESKRAGRNRCSFYAAE
jgi:two-component system CheB/CheR fusion protein